MWLTLSHAKGTSTIYSLCSTTWRCVTKKCKCSKNALHALTKLWSRCQLKQSESKRSLLATGWGNFVSSVDLWCNSAPSCPKYTDIRMHSNKPEKVFVSVIIWSTIWRSCHVSISKEKTFQYRSRIKSFWKRTQSTNKTRGTTRVSIQMLVSRAKPSQMSIKLTEITAIGLLVAF